MSKYDDGYRASPYSRWRGDTTLRTHARELRKKPTQAEHHLWRHLRRRQLDGHRFPYDGERTEWLESLGLRVLRFWNNEILGQIEAVKERMLKALSS